MCSCSWQQPEHFRSLGTTQQQTVAVKLPLVISSRQGWCWTMDLLLVLKKAFVDCSNLLLLLDVVAVVCVTLK